MKILATALVAVSTFAFLAPLARADEIRLGTRGPSAVIVVGPAHHRYHDRYYYAYRDRAYYRGHYWNRDHRYDDHRNWHDDGDRYDRYQ
jgi:hypothetical protein